MFITFRKCEVLMTETKMALAIMGLLAIGMGAMQQSEAAEASEIKKATETTFR